MIPPRVACLLTLVAVTPLLPSCCLVTVPVETAGVVVTSSVRVAEKTAITSVDVAGKTAGAVIDGKIPTTNRSVWDPFR